MANILYRKQKQQKSLDNGVTWIDTGEYRVGAVLENPSNCSGTDTKQCRWVELDASEGYYCDGNSNSKYTIQVEECTENGLIWTRTGNSKKGNTFIESNSCDCGYSEYRWNLDPYRYECDENSFSKYGVEVYQVGCGDNWQNVEPLQERLTDGPIECYSLDCGAVSNQLEFTWDTSISTYCLLKVNQSSEYRFYNSDGVVSTDMNTMGICKLTSTQSMFDNSVTPGRSYLTITKLPDTYYVTDMSWMFNNCNYLTSLDLSYLRTDNVGSMYQMFGYCRSLTSLDLNTWNTSNVYDMNCMFFNCSGLTELNISDWNTSNVTNMSSMFYQCYNLTSLDIRNWNTSAVTYMGSMFERCRGLTELDLSGWNTSNVTDMSRMFNNCINLTKLDLSGWDISNVTDMSGMFSDCTNLELIILNDVDCYTYNYIFSLKPENAIILSNSEECYDDKTFSFSSPSSNYCMVGINNEFHIVGRANEYQYSYFTNDTFVSASHFLDGTKGYNRWITYVSKMFDTSNVTDMSYMFYEMSDLKTLSVATFFNTSNVIDMSYMFYDCASLTSLNVSNWDISNVTNTENMFHGCNKLTKLIIVNDYDWWCERLTEASISCSIIEQRNCEIGIQINYSNYKLTYDDVCDFDNFIIPTVDVDLNTIITFGDCTTKESFSNKTINNYTITYSPSDYNNTFEDRIVTGTVKHKSFEQSFTFTQKGDVERNFISFQYKQQDSTNTDGRLVGIYFNDKYYTNTVDELIAVDVNNGIYQWSISTKNLGIDSINSIEFSSRTIRILSFVIFDKLTSTNRMFGDCIYIPSEDINNVVKDLDVSNVTDMNGMFWGCSGLTELDLSAWNVSKVTDMTDIFWGCNNLNYLNISNWKNNDITKVSINGNIKTIICRNSNVIPVGIGPLAEQVDFSNSNFRMNDFMNMFRDCSNLKNINFDGCYASFVYQIGSMFANCSSLETIDVSWITKSVYYASNVFYGCTSLKTLKVKSGLESYWTDKLTESGLDVNNITIISV